MFIIFYNNQLSLCVCVFYYITVITFIMANRVCVCVFPYMAKQTYHQGVIE